MTHPTEDQEHRAEAARLRLLPRADQRETITLYRSIASNPKVPKAERQAGLKRAAALERLLGLAGKKIKKNVKRTLD